MKDQLDFLDILKLFFSHWWQILISAILSAFVFYGISAYLLTPTYTSRGSLYVNNTVKESTDVSLTNIATSQQLALTYIEILSSDTFCKQIQETTQLPYSVAQLKSLIKISPQNNSQILEVRAVSPSPEESEILVNAVLNNAQVEIDRVVKGGVVSVIDQATLPTLPSSPNVSRNVFFGFLCGMILCMCVIFLIDTLDNRIKNESDLSKVHELPLLGLIPDIDITRLEEKKNVKK